jgi:DNA polymerase
MIDPRAELAGIAREARVLLERERQRGRSRIVMEPGPGANRRASVQEARSATEHPRPDVAPLGPVATAETLALPGFESLVPRSPGAPGGDARGATSAASADLPADLGALERMVAECRKCGLCETRTQTVFADGSPSAKLVFVGEAPGRDEDLKGLPFVGRAGQLLDKMIAAIQLRRDEVYICNVLKCRPPENRTPLPEEVERCSPYLARQLGLIRPALICALGLSAAQALLKTKASMATLRGRTFEYEGIPLIPTYHPAALLRNPSLKREAWEDMQRVRDTLRARTGH